MVQVFFDTEFTNMPEHGIPGLISIGCVAQNGSEFYAEVTDTWDERLCSLFVINTVLPLLQGGECQMQVADLAVKLKGWIESFEGEVIFRSDAPKMDWPFVEEIFNFHGWPKNLRKKCGDIYFNHDYQINRYQDALAEYWKEHSARQHHALIDARCQLYGWRKAIKRGI